MLSRNACRIVRGSWTPDQWNFFLHFIFFLVSVVFNLYYKLVAVLHYLPLYKVCTMSHTFEQTENVACKNWLTLFSDRFVSRRRYLDLHVPCLVLGVWRWSHKRFISPRKCVCGVSWAPAHISPPPHTHTHTHRHSIHPVLAPLTHMQNEHSQLKIDAWNRRNYLWKVI